MSGTWLDMADALIEANAPLQSRIFSRVARNSDARAYIPLVPGPHIATGNNEPDWGTLFEMPIRIPKFLIGPGGTRLRMTMECKIQIAAGNATATFRLNVKSTADADLSNIATISEQPGGTAIIVDFILDWTPASGDVYEDILWQSRSADSSADGEEIRWARTARAQTAITDENFIERLAL